MFKDFTHNFVFSTFLKKKNLAKLVGLRRKRFVTNFNMRLFLSLHPSVSSPPPAAQRSPGEHPNTSFSSSLHTSDSRLCSRRLTTRLSLRPILSLMLLLASTSRLHSLRQLIEETLWNKQLKNKHLPPCSAPPVVLRRVVLKFSRSVRANRAKHRPALFIHQGVFTHKSFTL